MRIIRWAIVALLLLAPTKAVGGVSLHLRVSPYWRQSYSCRYPVVQRWVIVPRRERPQPSPDEADTLRYNHLGQGWRVEPIPPSEDEPTNIPPGSDGSSINPGRGDAFPPDVFEYPHYRVLRTYHNIEVSSYNSRKEQTDGTPWEIRPNLLVYPCDVACNFLPRGTLFRLPNAPAPFNTKVYRVLDTTDSQYGNRIDLWLLRERYSKAWGVRRMTVEVLGPPKGEAPY